MRSVRPETMTLSCRVDGGQMKTNSSVSWSLLCCIKDFQNKTDLIL
jgi:hypothetical protein